MSLESNETDPIEDIHSDILCLEDNIEELQAGMDEATATDNHKEILRNINFCLRHVTEMRDHLVSAKRKIKKLIFFPTTESSSDKG